MGPDDLGDTLPASDAPPATTPDARVRGATIGRYIVLGTLGAGGMGIVYAAYDPELDRRIALKLLRGRATDATGRARIRREAQALARANHPNIVTVYDVGDHGDGVFIAMEIVEGGTLRDWQARHGWREVLDAYVAAGRGLAAAHARGLVHRDFKPENVLVSQDGHVRVTDFGLARLAEGSTTDRPDVAPSPSPPQADSALTADGAVMGTLGYMSPEQCDGSIVDARSDQYAWCVATWEALYGARPFRGATLLEIAGAMAGPAPDIPETPAIPRAIGRALLRGLAVEPDARWPMMEPLLAACAPPRRRRRRVLALAAAAVALLGSTIALVATRPAATAVCAASTSRLAGIWDGPRRDALAHHFATSARPDVVAALGLATRDFDTYATTWSAQWDAACASTERTRDPLLHAQRTNCLERTLVDLHGLVDAYLAVDPEQFASSWRGNAFTIWQTPLADCERIASIRATPPAPLPEARDEITRLVIDMHRARVEARAIVNPNSGVARLGPTLARLEAIVARLDALDSPIAAEAAWWRATYAPMPGKRTASERAMALARKHHSDRWLAFAYADEATTALDALHDPAAARTAIAEMDEAYERAGGDPKQFELHASIAAAEDRYADALDAIHAARTPGDALDHFGPDVAVAPEIRIDLVLGRVAEAVEAAHHHVARLEASWRGDHWIVADAHEMLAHVLLYAHDPAGALAELHASLDMHARIASPPQRMQSARYLVLACTTLLGREDERDAMVRTLAAGGDDDLVYLNALDLAVWAPGLVAWSLAHGKAGPDRDSAASAAAYGIGDVATAERLAGRTPASAATLEDAAGRFIVLAQVEARAGRAVDARLAALAHLRTTATPAERDHALVLEALVLAARGSWSEVRALVEAAAPVTLHPGSHERAQLDAAFGRALVETHEPARAIPVLERCLFQSYQVMYSYQNANELIADASFALARALWDSGGDRPRARALAAIAIARYTTFEAAQRAAAEAWLAAHATY